MSYPTTPCVTMITIEVPPRWLRPCPACRLPEGWMPVVLNDPRRMQSSTLLDVCAECGGSGWVER